MIEVKAEILNEKAFKKSMEIKLEAIAKDVREQSLPFKFAVAEEFLAYLLRTYTAVKGPDDLFASKMADWLAEHDMTPAQVLKEYPDNIEIVEEGGVVYIRPTSPKWKLVAQAMEFGTRLSTPIAHWGIAKKTFFSVNARKIDTLFKAYVKTVNWTKT